VADSNEILPEHLVSGSRDVHYVSMNRSIGRATQPSGN
jgi:hypothetical protein